MLRLMQWVGAAAILISLGACLSETKAPTGNRSSALAEVQGRDVRFPAYPQSNRTYLSFDQAHGFQVNFISGGGAAWLWYPGNSVALAEEFKLDEVAGKRAICWRHQKNTRNPVTQQTGGKFACEPFSFAQRRMVAELKGDPFGLAGGSIPFRLSRCKAPEEFNFDRNRFAC